MERRLSRERNGAATVEDTLRGFTTENDLNKDGGGSLVKLDGAVATTEANGAPAAYG